MDIVTHAMMGTAIAAPWIGHSPEASAGFVLGSALPDIDALSRVFGKRAFLVWHQTYTHSVGAVGILGIGALFASTISTAAAMLMAGCAAGMVVHISLDFTNTLGVKCWLPFENRRRCAEWVFFIDVPIMLLTLPFIGAIVWSIWLDQLPPAWLSIVYVGLLLGYVELKAQMRRAAFQAINPSAMSLIPSSIWPWRFLGYRTQGEDQIELLEFDLWRRQIDRSESVQIYDDRFQEVTLSPEFKIMRELSPGYHVVQVDVKGDGHKVICRDLRTRNFQTSFGELTLTIRDGAIVESHFNV